MGDGEGNQRGKKRKKENWGKYNLWQYQITNTDYQNTIYQYSNLTYTVSLPYGEENYSGNPI